LGRRRRLLCSLLFPHTLRCGLGENVIALAVLVAVQVPVVQEPRDHHARLSGLPLRRAVRLSSLQQVPQYFRAGERQADKGDEVDQKGQSKMNLSVGSSVTRNMKPPSEHGVVTEVGAQTVVVRWHLKEATTLGPTGTKVGTVYEVPEDLILDTPCPFCKP
jgi:hypothetical protein